ncbi:hypothetical protein C0Q70_03914 [Pomacea canaliculata]|uniref:Polysaccharide lyase 14 domain-containing protein n=1 Tax=Pomacea canaliculata TaxID=400727 RepID=A0A2T7PU16_POMCA|nr:hypothetical protein C0Q70_03914 [Pomacea canaliculata]
MFVAHCKITLPYPVPERVVWNRTSNNTWEVDFPPEHVWGKDSIAVVNDPAGGKENVLRVHFTKKHYWGSPDNPVGGGFLYPPIPPETAMLMSFDIYFSSNFDFSKGGKLPGLWGGNVDACGSGSYTEDCFTLRFVWREGGVGGIFAHLPRDQSPDFCDRPDVMCETSWGLGLGRGTWTFKKSRWQRISMYVKLNIPGHQDGYIKVELNELTFLMYQWYDVGST